MTTVGPKEKKERVIRSAKEKVQAVLSLWTQRRRPSEICRELSIQPTVLNHWQERAMEAMLEVLKPRTREAQEPPPMLPEKVERLLARKSQAAPELTKLQRRLAKLQQGPKPPEKEAVAAKA